MKVSIKTLKGEAAFTLEDVNENGTVLELKEKIREHQSWEVSRQKLIHAGKIMKDEELVSTYKVKDGGFIVCMLSKAKPAPKPAATPATPANTAPATPAPATPAPATPAPATPAPTTTAPTTAPPAPARVPPASSSTNPQFQAAIAQMKDMGFPEDQCVAALNAAFGDPDRAVEYLMTGIPEGVGLAQPPAVPATSGTETTAPAGAGNAPLSGLELLRSLPNINDLRRTVQNNPAELANVLRSLGQQNPALLEAINANREAFVAMMNEPITESAEPNAAAGGDARLSELLGAGGPIGANQFMAVLSAMQQMPPAERERLANGMGLTPEQQQALTTMLENPETLAQMFGAGGMGGGAGAPPPGTIQVTPEEMAAIDRLVELGFSKNACVQAYFACDKNEDMAANLLFTNPPEDEDMDDVSGGNGGN